MDQADHKEIISTEPGYAKPISKHMGTILLYPMTTKETHPGSSSKRIIYAQEQDCGEVVQGWNSRLE